MSVLAPHKTFSLVSSKHEDKKDLLEHLLSIENQ